MVEKDEWIPYTELDFDCQNNNKFWVDTRDFHAGYTWCDKPRVDLVKLNKYPTFFYTKYEIISLLDRLYTESGGDKNWRFLSVNGYGEHWVLKYIRIHRLDDNIFLVCDSEWRALRKSIIDQPVVLEYL